jgi:hypothetical protein
VLNERLVLKMKNPITAQKLRDTIYRIFPDDDHTEHPMTEVGVVLLAAGLHGITNPSDLMQLTGHSRAFISGVIFNLMNNLLWAENRYDASSWLSPDGTIDERALWENISVACGETWLREGDSELEVEVCRNFYAERNAAQSSEDILSDWEGLTCAECDSPATFAKIDINDCRAHNDVIIINSYCDDCYANNVQSSRWLRRPNPKG